MSNVGQKGRETQTRVVNYFQQALGYRYLGDWHDRQGNRNVGTPIQTCHIKKCMKQIADRQEPLSETHEEDH
ncbi:MAG: hypothetical protein IPM37_14860 [Hahellaceae bacterium]|jgi:type I restriction enzyme R subunit|nr:hypothetical protein [Hahellaceae bacterium]